MWLRSMQRGFLFVAHAAGEVRVVQALIAGGFRHIFQDTELLLDHLLAVPGHLLHPRQDVVLDVLALLGSQISPGTFFFAKVGALCGTHAVPLIELLADFGLLIGRKILKCFAVLQNIVALFGTQRTHLIHPGPGAPDAQLLPAGKSRTAVITGASIVRKVRLRDPIRTRRVIVGGISNLMADDCVFWWGGLLLPLRGLPCEGDAMRLGRRR